MDIAINTEAETLQASTHGLSENQSSFTNDKNGDAVKQPNFGIFINFRNSMKQVYEVAKFPLQKLIYPIMTKKQDKQKEHNESLELKVKEQDNVIKLRTLETQKLKEENEKRKYDEMETARLKEEEKKREAEERREKKEARLAEIELRVKNEIDDLRNPEQQKLYEEFLEVHVDGYSTRAMDELLVNNRIWAKWPISLEDGSIVNCMQLGRHVGSTFKIADPIEPKKGNDVATLVVNDMFNMVIETPLRGGLSYPVYFTLDDLLIMVRDSAFNNVHMQSLKNYLAEMEKIDMQRLKRFVDAAFSMNFDIKDEYAKFEQAFIRDIECMIDDKIRKEVQRQSNEIMKEYAYVIGEKARIVHKTTGQERDAKFLKEYFNEDKITVTHPITGEKKNYHPLDIWSEIEKKSKFNNEVFYPGAYEGDAFNKFKGIPVQAEEVVDVSPFLEFIHTELCNSDLVLYGACMTFFKKAIEEPASKYGTAIALIGDAVRLKALFLKPWRSIFGEYYFKASSAKQLFGENLHLKEKLMVEINDKLIKDSDLVMVDSFITDERFSYIAKGGKVLIDDNYSKCIFDCSNNDFPVKTAKMDRLIKLEVSDAKADDREYLDRLNKLISDKGFAPSLVHFLQEFDSASYEQYLVRPPVKNVENEEIQASFSVVESYLYEAFCEGKFEGVHAQLKDDGSIRVSNSDMYESVKSFAKFHGKRMTMDSQAFGTEVTKILKKCSLLISNSDKLPNKSNAKTIAALSKCRAAFEEFKELKPIESSIKDWQVIEQV